MVSVMSLPFSKASKPQRQKDAVFLNATFAAADEILNRLGDDAESFKLDARAALEKPSGDDLHESVDQLYKAMLARPAVSDMASCMMDAAQKSASSSSLSGDDQMQQLRHKWLNKLSGCSSSSSSSSSSSPAFPFSPSFCPPTSSSSSSSPSSSISNSHRSIKSFFSSNTASAPSSSPPSSPLPTFSNSSGSDPADQAGFISIPVFYGTNRQPSGHSEQHRFFGTARSESMSYGVSWVSVPDEFGYGQGDNHPTWHYFGRRQGVPRSKVVQAATTPIPESKFFHRLRVVAAQTGQPEAIVFIHGFNVPMSNACKRMAQVAYSSNFRGLSLVFSWPSNESMAKYSADEGNVMWAINDFRKFLLILLMEVGLSKIHVIAHSMGTRAAIYGLLRIFPDTLPIESASIGRVVLAAPDFDLSEFFALAGELHHRCERIAIYCSSEDQALGLSRSLHGGYPRLGDYRGFLDLPKRPTLYHALGRHVDAIDATGSDSSFMKHVYIFDAAWVMMDCGVFLCTGAHPEDRLGLVKRMLPSGLISWAFSEDISERNRSTYRMADAMKAITIQPWKLARSMGKNTGNALSGGAGVILSTGSALSEGAGAIFSSMTHLVTRTASADVLESGKQKREKERQLSLGALPPSLSSPLPSAGEREEEEKEDKQARGKGEAKAQVKWYAGQGVIGDKNANDKQLLHPMAESGDEVSEGVERESSLEVLEELAGSLERCVVEGTLLVDDEEDEVEGKESTVGAKG